MLRNRRAFTLVEILIVVVLLGILAAIVIPQFGSFTDDANASRISSDLKTIRSQVELYKFHHGYYPGDVSDDRDGSSYDGEQFVTDLTESSEVDGVTYGPYLGSFPVNPLADAKGGEISVADKKPITGIGWWFNQTRSIVEVVDGTAGAAEPLDAKAVALVDN